jgi:hypothetical protein
MGLSFGGFKSSGSGRQEGLDDLLGYARNQVDQRLLGQWEKEAEPRPCQIGAVWKMAIMNFGTHCLESIRTDDHEEGFAQFTEQAHPLMVEAGLWRG